MSTILCNIPLFLCNIFFIKSIINCKIPPILLSPLHLSYFPRSKFQARSRNFNLTATIILTIQTNLCPHPLQNDQPGGGQEISKRSNGICSSSSVECRFLSVSHLLICYQSISRLSVFHDCHCYISWKTKADYWSIFNKQ